MRTVVGLFDRFQDAQNVVRELRDVGFRGDEINLIARDAEGRYTQSLSTTGTSRGEDASGGAGAGAGIGAVLGGIAGFLVGLGALAIPGIGPVIAAGPIIGALGGAGIGAVGGGLIGALVDWGVPDEHANYYAEGVRRGGTLVAVRADDARVDQALDIMNRYHPVDIERQASEWRQKNWSRFDPNAEPLTGEHMQYNRAGYTSTTERDMMDRDVMDRDYDREYSTFDRTASNVPVTGDRDMDMTRDRGFDTDSTTMETGGAMGGVMPEDENWSRNEPMYRQHYQSYYGAHGRNYDLYRPAYRFGYDLARNPRYRDYDWDRIEPDARLEWERQGYHDQSLWEDVKDAVRHAWDSIRY